MAAGDKTPGRRVESKPWMMMPGDYAVRVDGGEDGDGGPVAWVVTPNGHGPARLRGWTLTEHEDRTITVSPSILAHPSSDTLPGWHGYLERGVWREV